MEFKPINKQGFPTVIDSFLKKEYIVIVRKKISLIILLSGIVLFTGITPDSYLILSKWDLWQNGAKLRGANIYQRRVYPELDGLFFLGEGPVGPPYSQEDFLALASLGANLVNISHPGLFSEKPPYQPDQKLIDNLDRLLEMIHQADLFAIISFRTGPGRSEFTFFWGEEGDWFDSSYYNDLIWVDKKAQAAWTEMWRFTADRYRHHPAVVGYDLMVEPNANEIWLDIWDPAEFYSQYWDSLYDWNQLYPRIIKAIREVDPSTPILVEALAYANLTWLPYLQPVSVPRIVYVFHQYDPHLYTHQEPQGPVYSYPGQFDIDNDGQPESFTKEWLKNYLSLIDEFKIRCLCPVAANEFGVVRWAPGAADFLDDQIDLLEKKNINHAVWIWNPGWPPYSREVDYFDYRHGPDPNTHTNLDHNPLLQVLQKYWRRNYLRPSRVIFRSLFSGEALQPSRNIQRLKKK